MPQNVDIGTDTPLAGPAVDGAAKLSDRHALEQFSLNHGLTLGEYVTPDQLAQHLGVSVRTLSRWHARRIGPPRCSVGKLILYRVIAVRAWMAEREFTPVTPAMRRSAGGHR
jgi:predicted DNA-binding transcriptional regulator YafY